MYCLAPLKVYMVDRVRREPQWLARVHRVGDAIGYPRDRIAAITERNLPQVVAELGRLWPPNDPPPGRPLT